MLVFGVAFGTNNKIKKMPNCQTCGRIYKSVGGLAYHLHDGECPTAKKQSLRKLVICSKCNKNCRTSAYLASHLNVCGIPTKKSLSDCAKCSKNFQTPQRLEKHKLVCGLEKHAFVCETCKRVFTTQSEYARHGKNGMGCRRHMRVIGKVPTLSLAHAKREPQIIDDDQVRIGALVDQKIRDQQDPIRARLGPKTHWSIFDLIDYNQDGIFQRVIVRGIRMEDPVNGTRTNDPDCVKVCFEFTTELDDVHRTVYDTVRSISTQITAAEMRDYILSLKRGDLPYDVVDLLISCRIFYDKKENADLHVHIYELRRVPLSQEQEKQSPTEFQKKMLEDHYRRNPTSTLGQLPMPNRNASEKLYIERSSIQSEFRQRRS